MSLVLALSLLAAADTGNYVVLNHGRPAGEMLVIRGAEALRDGAKVKVES